MRNRFAGWLLAALAASTAVHAQEAPTEAETNVAPDTVPVQSIEDKDAEQTPIRRSTSRLVEEIIVTAEKREENLKDVPISVSAYSAAKLDALAVIDSGDLPRIAPGLTINNRIGFATTFLRGVGSNAFLLGDPLVVTYIDGVYFPFAGGQVQNLGSVQQIEVLKGPQGTLFGRNALGGAIRIETRDPSLTDRQLSLQTLYSTRYHNSSTRAYVSTPLSDTLAVNLSGFYNRADHYSDGQLDSGNGSRGLPRTGSEAYRAKLLWQPADWLRAKLGVYQLHQDGAGTYAINTEPSNLGRAAGIQPGADPYAGKTNDFARTLGDTFTTFGELSTPLQWADLKLLASYQKVEFTTTYDFDGSPQAVAAFGSKGTSDVKTYELQVLSNDSSPDWFKWIVGSYFFDSLGGIRDAFFKAGGVDLRAGTFFGTGLPPALVAALQPFATQSPVDSIVIGLDGVLSTKSIAFYTQTNFEFTDWVGLTLGGRYQSEKRVLEDSSTYTRDANGNKIRDTQSYNGRDDPAYRDTTRAFDPKVSLNLRPQWAWLGESPLIYLSYQSATTSSTFNTLNINNAPERVNGTKIKAFEIGLKTRLLDGLIDFNTAVFDYDISDPQVQVISLFAGGAVSFENAESQRIRGVEFDTIVQVLPAVVDDLILTASGAYLDAVYSSFTSGSGFDENTGAFRQNSFDFTGNRIEGSPKLSGTVGLLKTFQTARGPLEMGVNFYYSDETFSLAQNIEQSRVAPYKTLAANIGYLYEPLRTRLTVYGTNILNERYKSSRFVTDFGPNDGIGPLSEFGLRLNYDF